MGVSVEWIWINCLLMLITWIEKTLNIYSKRSSNYIIATITYIS